MSVGPPGGGSVTGTSVTGYGLGSSIGCGGSGPVGPVGSSGIGKSGLSFGSSDGVGGRFCSSIWLITSTARLRVKGEQHCRGAYQAFDFDRFWHHNWIRSPRGPRRQGKRVRTPHDRVTVNPKGSSRAACTDLGHGTLRVKALAKAEHHQALFCPSRCVGTKQDFLCVFEEI